MSGAIFVDRTTDTSRDMATEAIVKRQKEIYEGKLEQPCLIFSDSMTNNGTRLLQFKKGAFSGMYPVLPMVIVVESDPISDTWDGTHLLFSLIVSLSQI